MIVTLYYSIRCTKVRIHRKHNAHPPLLPCLYSGFFLSFTKFPSDSVFFLIVFSPLAGTTIGVLAQTLYYAFFRGFSYINRVKNPVLRPYQLKTICSSFVVFLALKKPFSSRHLPSRCKKWGGGGEFGKQIMILAERF